MKFDLAISNYKRKSIKVDANDLIFTYRNTGCVIPLND